MTIEMTTTTTLRCCPVCGDGVPLSGAPSNVDWVPCCPECREYHEIFGSRADVMYATASRGHGEQENCQRGRPNIEIRECAYPFAWLVRPLTAVLVVRFEEPRTRDQVRSEIEGLAAGTVCVALANRAAERGWWPPRFSYHDAAPSREWTVHIEGSEPRSADYWLARVSCVRDEDAEMPYHE